ncbi:MAG: ROK family protein, partial [Phycisphaerales bacterium]
ARTWRPTRAHEGSEAVLGRIEEAAREVCEKAGCDLAGIPAVGIVSPGGIDRASGVVLDAPNLGWTDLPLRELLQSKLGRPVVVENDVNGAVWGEYMAAREEDAEGSDLLGVWVGTGVGGGLILNGAIHHGPLSTAGEIGQTVIAPHEPTGLRTVEDHASRTGFSRFIRQQLESLPDSVLRAAVDAETGVVPAPELQRAWMGGDELARRTIDRVTNALGVAIANTVTLLAIDRVVIGGGVTEALGEPFLDAIRGVFEANVFPARCRSCSLQMTRLEADAGLIGAALLARTEARP